MNIKHWNALAPVLVIIAGIFWGIIGIFTKRLAMLGLSSLQITQVRCIIAATILVVVCLFTNKSLLRIKLKHLPVFIGTGIISIAFFNICYFTCIQKSTLSVACILLYTAPCFVMIMSCLFFGEAFTKEKMVSLCLAFIGCVFTTGVFSGSSVHIVSGLALLIGLCSGFCYALYSIFGRIALKYYHWMTVITYTFILAALALLPFCHITKIYKTVAGSFSHVSTAVFLGVFCTILPFLLYTTALNHMDTAKASILTFVEPLVATLLSIFYFKEAFSFMSALGILCIIGSLVVVNTSKS